MSTFHEILDAARTLSAGDRLKLLNALWEDVPTAEWPVPSPEWIAEARRRSEQFDQGKTTAAPWSEVRTRARREAGLDG